MASEENLKETRAEEALRVYLRNALAENLNIELDAIGYPKESKLRSIMLGKLLGLTSSAAYRILRGLTSPNLDYMAKIRGLGISLDRIADKALGPPETYSVKVGGQLSRVSIRKNANVREATAALVPNGEFYDLIQIVAGTHLPARAIAIDTIQFVAQLTLAIIEDDKDSLKELNKVMTKQFRTATFASATKLFDKSNELELFNAFILDWKLPDMDGKKVIEQIRERTKAPIFILTADTSAALKSALDLENVHHVSKPADPDILAKRITKSIKGY